MSGADLTLEFVEGGAAANAGDDRSSCPYLATSNAADAWHAGHVYQQRASCNSVERVTKGRGERLNLHVIGGAKTVATVRWNAPGDDPLPPVDFEPAGGWSPAMKAAERRPIDRDRQALELELRAAAPMQARGRAVADAGHLPLFVAGNEPDLFA